MTRNQCATAQPTLVLTVRLAARVASLRACGTGPQHNVALGA